MHTSTDAISGEKNEVLFVMIGVLMPATMPEETRNEVSDEYS